MTDEKFEEFMDHVMVVGKHEPQPIPEYQRELGRMLRKTGQNAAIIRTRQTRTSLEKITLQLTEDLKKAKCTKL